MAMSSLGSKNLGGLKLVRNVGNCMNNCYKKICSQRKRNANKAFQCWTMYS